MRRRPSPPNRLPAVAQGLGRRPRGDEDFTGYVAVKLPALHRVAYLLCQDWQRADDLVQAAFVKLYVHWGRARGMDNLDAYVRAILVREFLRERRSLWTQRVVLSAEPWDHRHGGAAPDREAMIDLRDALAKLPKRQRATLVLRFYCDLTVDQVADLLGCSPGTVKSQTVKGLNSLRRTPEVGALLPDGLWAGPAGTASGPEVHNHE